MEPILYRAAASRRPFKQLIVLLIFAAAILPGCIAMKDYTYQTSMVHPRASNELFYANDTFSIRFELQRAYLKVFIDNRSNEGIRINWDEVSIAIGGKTYQTLHRVTDRHDINEPQPPTTIPPHSNLDDYLVPRENVEVARTREGNHDLFSSSFKDLFPLSDYGTRRIRALIESRKGQRVTVFLPFYIRGEYKSYYYDLLINDVVQKPKPARGHPKY